MTVVGSGLVGMLIYAGLFYSNARRTIPDSSTIDSSVFLSKESAENAANEWITLGGIYVGLLSQLRDLDDVQFVCGCQGLLPV